MQTIPQHLTILGCDDNIVSMIFEIIRPAPGDRLTVDIVKNIALPDKRFPYRVEGIEHNEVPAENWHRSGGGYILGVVTPSAKRAVRKFFLTNFGVEEEEYLHLLHNSVQVAGSVTFGNGVVVNPGVVIAPYSVIGRFVYINRNASIGHHTVIGKDATINPGANIAGHCRIGEGVTVGMGANILDKISVGENSVIGAGSLVTKDIPANVVAFGSPAKVVKEL